MALQKPAERTPTISWSLNKVLPLLTFPEYSGPAASETNLLSRAIFLVTLACGARMSEISALRRGKSHVIQRSNGHLMIIPSRTFLAKNEDPARRCMPITLGKLDSDNPLCPVSALQSYLEAIRCVQQDALFMHPNTSTPLSIKGLTKRMVTLIRKADPGSFPLIHDIKKYATTLVFFGGCQSGGTGGPFKFFFTTTGKW